MSQSSQQAVARVFATRGFAWMSESSLPKASEGTPLLDDEGNLVGFVEPPNRTERDFFVTDGITALDSTERTAVFEELDRVERALITTLVTTSTEKQEKWLIEEDARIDSNHSSTLEAEDLPGLGRRQRAEISVRVARAVLAGKVDFGPEIRTMLDRVLELRRQLFRDSLRLVVDLARKYRRQTDLTVGILRGALGLDKALDRFEPDRRLQFSTYATWWIRQNIQRSVYDFADAIRTPVHAAEQVSRFWRIQQELWARAGICPEDQDVLTQGSLKFGINRLGIYRRQAHMCWLRRGFQPGFAESIIDSDIPSTIEGNPDSGWVEVAKVCADRWVEKYGIRSRGPSGRWQEIFVRRILRTRHDRTTLQEIGDDFGISRERIRQLESKLIAYLQKQLCQKMEACSPWDWRMVDE